MRATRTLDLRTNPLGRPLKPGLFDRGFEYSDCRVDDSRLVVLNARDAADRGVDIRTRTIVETAERGPKEWTVRVRDKRTGAVDTLRCRVLINAAGPWVEKVMVAGLALKAKARVRLVQGSHIVVRKLYDHDRAYILQNPDGRIVFAIPFERDFTLIGTTDRDYDGDPAEIFASAEEIDYLCRAASENFTRPVTVADVVLELFGRPAALRRRRERSQGRHARLCFGDGRARRRRPGDFDFWREDYDLSTPCRGGAATRRARVAFRRRKQGLDRQGSLAGRRLSRRRSRDAGSEPLPRLPVPFARRRRSTRPGLWHARPAGAWLGETPGGSGRAVRRFADRGGDPISDQ